MFIRLFSSAGLSTAIVAPALAAGSAWADEPASAVMFVCKDDKTIEATFDAGKVDLRLSDGRILSLPQVISGSGARYANSDETFVFRNTGDTAIVIEGADDRRTFSDCVAR